MSKVGQSAKSFRSASQFDWDIWMSRVPTRPRERSRPSENRNNNSVRARAVMMAGAGVTLPYLIRKVHCCFHYVFFPCIFHSTLPLFSFIFLFFLLVSFLSSFLIFHFFLPFLSPFLLDSSLSLSILRLSLPADYFHLELISPYPFSPPHPI